MSCFSSRFIVTLKKKKKKGSTSCVTSSFSRAKRKRKDNISDSSLSVLPRPPSLSVCLLLAALTGQERLSTSPVRSRCFQSNLGTLPEDDWWALLDTSTQIPTVLSHPPSPLIGALEWLRWAECGCVRGAVHKHTSVRRCAAGAGVTGRRRSRKWIHLNIMESK